MAGRFSTAPPLARHVGRSPSGRCVAGGVAPCLAIMSWMALAASAPAMPLGKTERPFSSLGGWAILLPSQPEPTYGPDVLFRVQALPLVVQDIGEDRLPKVRQQGNSGQESGLRAPKKRSKVCEMRAAWIRPPGRVRSKRPLGCCTQVPRTVRARRRLARCRSLGPATCRTFGKSDRRPRRVP